jgi:hypothetical protein
VRVTFVDAGVLIATARGIDHIAHRALAILDEPDRIFASSIFVRLEVLPKPSYLKRKAEVEFYERYFRSVDPWLTPDEHFDAALKEACRTGLSAMVAVHLQLTRPIVSLAVCTRSFYAVKKQDLAGRDLSVEV